MHPNAASPPNEHDQAQPTAAETQRFNRGTDSVCPSTRSSKSSALGRPVPVRPYAHDRTQCYGGRTTDPPCVAPDPDLPRSSTRSTGCPEAQVPPAGFEVLRCTAAGKPTQPDRSEPTDPARQGRTMGTARPKTAGPTFRRHASTAGRPDPSWAGTRSVPAERPEGRRPATSSDRANQAGTYQRTQPPAKASSRSSSSPARQRGHTILPRQDWTATPHPTTMNISFHRNASSTANSIRSSVVPAERHSIQTEVRTIAPSAQSRSAPHPNHAPANRPHIEPPRSIGTINRPFLENATQTNRSFKQDESGVLRSTSTHVAHTGWPVQRVDQPHLARHHSRTAGTRRHAGTLSTLRPTVTHREQLNHAHSNRLNAPPSHLTKASRAVHDQSLLMV